MARPIEPSPIHPSVGSFVWLVDGLDILYARSLSVDVSTLYCESSDVDSDGKCMVVSESFLLDTIPH